jgi:hypothetical protein
VLVLWKRPMRNYEREYEHETCESAREILKVQEPPSLLDNLENVFRRSASTFLEC